MALRKDRVSKRISKARPKGVLIGPYRLAQELLGKYMQTEGIVDIILNTDDVTCALDAIAGEASVVLVIDDETSRDLSKLVQSVLDENGDASVIILSSRSHPSYVSEAANAGAKAYVDKMKASATELASVIREVLENNSCVFHVVIDSHSISDLSSPEHWGERQVLSGKELKILNHIAEGCSNKEIAKITYNSEQTVKVHVHNIFDKLGARDRAHAVAIGFMKKIIM